MSKSELQDKVSEIGAKVIGPRARWTIASWATRVQHSRESTYYDVGYEQAKYDLLVRIEQELGIRL